MRIIELFAGIGACSKALENLGINLEIVDAVEIDKYAMKSFNAIHNTNFEVQDIKKWDKDLKDIDIITHGSPCQDFSLAGKQAGGDIGSGTRSSLMYETIRIVGKIRPKYILWENVKNLLSKKHKHNFDAYIETMNILGYNSYYQVLNAKDYGIPQNRERVYTISIRKDIDKGNFKFPEKEELKLRLKDILETNVDEKYYLKDYQIENIKKSNFMSNRRRIQEKEYCDTLCARDWKDPKCVQVAQLDIKGHDCIKRVYSDEGISPTLTDMQGGNRQPKILELPCIAASRGRNPENPSDRTPGIETEQRLGINNKGTSNCITTVQKDNYVLEKNKEIINPLKNKTNYGWHFEQNVYDINGSVRSIKAGGGSGNIPKAIISDFKIRKLTPKECWRLMGFSDEDFEKAEKVPTSNTQLYKQAGNSICVPVLERIFKNLLIGG